MVIKRMGKDKISLICMPSDSFEYTVEQWKEFANYVTTKGTEIVTEIKEEQKQRERGLIQIVLCKNCGHELECLNCGSQLGDKGKQQKEQREEMVEMECPMILPFILKESCPVCHGTGKILRPMTDEEKAARKLGQSFLV